MTPEFDFFGLYFSSIVPRFILGLLLWVPLHRLCGAVGLYRWCHLPALTRLALFLVLLAAMTFGWHP